MKQISNIKIVLLLITLTAAGMFSACNVGSEQPEANVRLQESTILAPATDGVNILLGSPVQVQTAYPANQTIAKVELWVQGDNEPTEKLIRADTLENGVVLQEWNPQQIGKYTLKVRAWDTENQAQADLVRHIEVVENRAVAVAEVTNEEEASTLGEAASFGELPTPTPTPANPDLDATLSVDVKGTGQGQSQATESETQSDVVKITVLEETVAGPTAIPHYPPPPPAPGVHPGPTQEELTNVGPPVCNAAEYVDVYTTDTSRRVFISEPDKVPAKTVGGTVVHRAWRLQNVGTCTWGPGYELAFYGGRAMGSGGVAFDAIFPSDPARHNTVIDRERLVVPEGKPNQTAVLEVLLEAPTTPGIHQSYWRMRDPHGAFFGPIVGVTLEVVRNCEFGVYGAPVINRFRFSGAGNVYDYVYDPTNPAEVSVQLGDAVTLDWQIINATNFDVVFESPTGRVDTASTSNSTDRANYTIDELGDYIVTLYADNGSCTAEAQIIARSVPRYKDQFVLNVYVPGAASAPNAQSENLFTSSSLSAGTAKVEWRHFDQDVDDLALLVDLYVESAYTYCPGFDSILGWRGHCYETSEWKYIETIEKAVGSDGDAQGAAVVGNIEKYVCANYPGTSYQLRYQMHAEKDGQIATPELSNKVEVNGRCGGAGPRDEIR